MLPIPAELWTYVFRQLRRGDLVSLARTCRAFRTIAQAELYRDVKLQNEKESILFSRTLAERPWFAGLVFQITHIFALFTSSPALGHISSFLNLRSVSIDLILIDSGLCAALQNLPRLQRITWATCTIDPHLDASQMQLAWGRNLTTVNIVFPEGPEAGWIAVIPPSISVLALFLPPSPAPAIFSIQNLFSSLMLRCQIFELTFLTLMNDIPKNTIEFLISCPRLRQITLQGSFIEEDMSFSSLPLDSLPMLELFSGSSEYVEHFISGRSIHDVTIYLSSEDSDNALMSLGRSLVPLTKVRLGASQIKAEWLRDIPATVGFLEVHEHDRTGDPSWIPDLHRMSTLYTLRVTGSPVDTEQRALVDTVSTLCKSLRELVFAWEEPQERLSKCYTWRWRQGLPWECYPDIRVY